MCVGGGGGGAFLQDFREAVLFPDRNIKCCILVNWGQLVKLVAVVGRELW